MFEKVRCMWMRGGTSKGGYFLAEDLPKDKSDFYSVRHITPWSTAIGSIGLRSRSRMGNRRVITVVCRVIS
jgi:2-methylaconitate cis-trans-isomerase PrpF